MSESKKHRSIDEIKKDYDNSAWRAGNLQYQIVALSKDLDLVNSTLRDLNLEAAASQGAAAKEAQQAAAAPSTPIAQVEEIKGVQSE